QATEAPVIASEQDAFNAASGLSVQELESILESDGSTSSAPSTPSATTEEQTSVTPPKEEQPATQQEGQPPPQQTQPAPEPDDSDSDEDSDEPLPKNWRVTATNDADARVFKLRKQEPGISLAEAMRRT